MISLLVICNILELSNTTETLRSIDEEYHSSVELNGGFSTGLQTTNVVKEADLFQLKLKQIDNEK